MRKLLTILFLTLLIAGFVWHVAPADAQPIPTLSLVGVGVAGRDETTTFDIQISDAVSAAGFDFDMEYDPAIAAVTGMTLTTALGEAVGNCDPLTGRCIVALGPLDRSTAGQPIDRTAFGGYSYGAGALLSSNGSVGTISLHTLPSATGSTVLRIVRPIIVDGEGVATIPQTIDGLLTIDVPTAVGLQTIAAVRGGNDLLTPALLIVAGALGLLALLVTTQFRSTWQRGANRRSRIVLVLLVGGAIGLFAMVRAQPAAAQSTRLPATAAAGPINPDVNGDRAFTVIDAQLIAGLYGVTDADGNWNPAYDLNDDGVIDELDSTLIAARWRTGMHTVTGNSPMGGEVTVSLTRETIVHFSGALDPSTVQTDTLALFFNDWEAPRTGRTVLSAPGNTLTRFSDSVLPASSRITAVIDGTGLVDAEGYWVDTDGDGTPGGRMIFSYDTISLTTVAGTAICGHVFASELTAQLADEPLVGVTISVDGAAGTLLAVTDVDGYFCLDPAPLGRFFVHVDGRTATNSVAPGAYYPFVGKPYQSVAGYSTDVGNIYLPLVVPDTLQAVSPTSDTVIHFPSQVIADHPEFADVEITVPADSLYGDDGTRGGMVGIAPVPPDRLPGQLPAFLDFPVVITVQTDGATNFDTPAPICFPNLPLPSTGQPLPPNGKSALHSFNHDSGTWTVVGPMTVTADGTLVCSDPGVGIEAPGWHGSLPGTKLDVSAEPLPPPECPEDLATNPNAARAACAVGTGGRVGALLSGSLIPNIVCNASGRAPTYVFDYLCDLIDDAFSNKIQNAVEDGKACVERMNQCLEDIIGIPIYRRAELRQGLLFNSTARSTNRAGWTSQMEAWLAEYEQIYSQLGDDLLLHIALGNQFRAIIGSATNDGELTSEQIAQLTPIISQLDTLLGGLSAYEFYMPQIERMRELEQLMRTDPVFFGSSQPRGRYLLLNKATGSVRRGETLPGGALDSLLLAPNTGYALYRVFPIPTGVSDTARSPEYFDEYDLIKLIFNNFTSGDPGACEELPDGGWYPGDDEFPAALRAAPTVDGDGDRLSALEEYIIGTSDSTRDSDDDGIDDAAEFLQGSDPADGLPVTSGIVASGATTAAAQDVCIANNVAAVAEGSAGVELFDVFLNGNPVLLGRIETLGSADRVTCAPGRLAIADNNGGILIYDTTIPTNPVLLDATISIGSASAIASDNLTTYVGTTSGQVVQLDLLSGQMINAGYVSGAVVDVGLGDFVYVLTSNKLYTLDRATLVRRDTATLSGNNKRLFVGDNLLTIVHQTGYSTYDLADPSDPLLITHGTTATTGWRQMTLNGSGLGLAAVGANANPATDRTLNLYDVSDPTQTNVLRDIYDTPGRVNATAIYNAQAYVADDFAGLQVVNYLPNDALGVPPTLAIAADDGDLTIEPGQIVRLHATVSDDVQVRQVFFLVNGRAVFVDGTYPFAYTLIAPPLTVRQALPLSVRAIAIDTGGNSVTSNALAFNVVADATAPTIMSLSPNNNSVERVDNMPSITTQFSEVISTTTLAGNVSLWEAGLDGATGTGDDVAVGIDVAFRPMERLLTVQPAAPLAVGKYLVQFSTGITDRSGNPLDQAYSSVFSVRTPVFWKNAVTGNWATGANWSTNVVPTSADYVVVDHTGSSAFVVQVTNGNAGTLEIRNPLAVVSHNSGSMTVQDDIINYGQFQIGGPTGNTTLVNGEFFNQGTFRAYPTGSNSARINGRVFHNNGTANIDDTFNFNRADAVFESDGVVNVAAAGQFFLAASNQTFVQSSGYVTVTAGGRFQNSVTPATVVLDGGHWSGSGSTAFSWNTLALTVGPEMTFSNATVAAQGNNTLTGDIPTGLTLWLRSNGTLTTEGDWTNDGRLLLGPSSYGGGPYSRVYINNGTLTSNGTIEDTTSEGSGASDRAALFGDVINNGLIRAHLGMDFKQPGATLVNNGAIDVTSSGIVWFSAAGETFIQAGGHITIASGGRMHNTVSPVTVDFQGGRQTGSSTFNWSNVALSIDPAMEFVGATFRTNGANNTFAGVIPAGLTLWLSSNGDLTTDGNWTNNGRLLLGPSSYGGGPYSRVFINNGALINNGTLEDTNNVGAGDSDRAAVYGDVINNGLIRSNQGIKYKQAGASLVNNGTIDMVGNLKEFILDQAILTNHGVIEGDGRLRFLSAPNMLDGTLRPGRTDRAAILYVRGGMVQPATAVTNIEIGGTTVDTLYDQVNVTDANATISGTLNIALIGGFVPALGNSFTIINNAGRTLSGRYDTITGLTIDATRMFQVNYLASSVQLQVVEGTLKVNDPGDAPDADAFDALCDSDLVTPGSQCTLRAAIAYANGHPGLDGIGFDLPPGSLTIQPASPLPSITGPTIIDGYSQPGASPNTLATGNNAVLLVELDGSQAGYADGLQLTGGASTIRGLVVNRFQSAGIRINSSGNHIAGNFIGTNAAGTVALGNLDYGIHVTSGSSNLIGGSDPAERNLISGNGGATYGYGIQLELNASGTMIQGNYIGVDRHGQAALGNDAEGIFLLSDHNIIGGATIGAGNLVSGNGRNGINLSVSGMANENTLQGNIIGADSTGLFALPNAAQFGIIVGGNDNLIGGTTPAARNIVSGNAGGGMAIHGSRNSVQGNYIGTNITGEAALGNNSGISLVDLSNIGPAADNVIGGSANGAGNVIAGNLYNGISLCCSELYRTTIQGNLIGVSAVTQSPLGNGWNGITVITSQTSETGDILSQIIGGRGPGEANVIAYNQAAGIHVGHAANRITISGNSLFANGTIGIDLSDRWEDYDGVDRGGDGVTPNDPEDQTAGESGSQYKGGGNHLRNFPVIAAAAQVTGTTTITGSLNSTANATYQLEFFANAACSVSGFGEGETYLGMVDVTTDASGNAAFVVAFPLTVPAGYLFTATSTDGAGNTSEFSRCAPQPYTPTVYTVTTTADSGPGSLRQAIVDANANYAADTIVFNIPGSGPHTITPLSRLPNISDPVILDAATQPGASCPTPVIELDGSQAGGFVIPGAPSRAPVTGLVITGGNSTVRGLIINRFSGAGLRIQSNGGVVVECNFIGTDRNGTGDQGNLGLAFNTTTAALDIVDTADNRIGGALPAQRNLISGNGTLPKRTPGIRVAGPHATGNLIAGNLIGVDVTGTAVIANTDRGIILAGGASANVVGGTSGAGFSSACAGACNLLSGNPNGGVAVDNSNDNIIQGNFIGTDLSGSVALPNGWGITVNESAGNAIGGSSPGAGNLISGNSYDGVSIGALSLANDLATYRDNVVEGNRIGTDRTGNTPLGNGYDGVSIYRVSYNTVGGHTPGAANLIAYNGASGVSVVYYSGGFTGGVGNAILANAIYGNTSLGIDLGGDGITLNDASDGDTGANGLQNYPVLSAATTNGGTLSISGTLDTISNSLVTIEVYYSLTCDSSGYGEGEVYIGSFSGSTNGSGHLAFSKTLSGAVPNGAFVTVTATDLDGNTSEFAACMATAP